MEVVHQKLKAELPWLIITPMTAGEIKGAEIVPSDISLNLFVNYPDIKKTEDALKSIFGDAWANIVVRY